MYTKQLKEAVLNCDIDKEVKRAHFADFVNGGCDAILALYDVYGTDVVNCASQLNRNSFLRRKRVRERIGRLIREGKVIFLTLTFTDDTLSRTNEKTRRRYVSRYLKANCLHYVANIDYGGRNGREHYHALVVADNLDYKPWHKFGAINGERVHDSEKDEKKTTKYLVKLSRHALKDKQGTCPRLIYSRNCSALE